MSLIKNLNEPNAQQTELLLKSISDRLASREDCKGINYKVIIDYMGVRMEPLVIVYRNRYCRKETDRMNIVSYVHRYKMKDVKLTEFVFGTYEYQYSADTKKRRWRRTDET